ncbi:MAG: protoheme IX farnesyltransferase [Planctomycetes bacterium]|nr:protoheme IX farnesyltransferase [Planctomycetota bacterium]
MSAVTETSAPRPSLAVRLGAFVELGKLRLSSLAIFAVIAGVHLGTPFRQDAALILPTALGSLLVAVAGNAFNMFLERDIDRLMERTRSRPLPSGRLRPGEVVAFATVCGAAGLATMALATNLLATLLSAGILLTYVCIYTPMKRRTPLNTVVGAVPGALPPVVGYAAASGRLDVHAAALFLILFLWQVPHFLAISWRYRDDYRRGGLKMIASLDGSDGMVRRLMLSHTLALICVSLLPYYTGLAGEAYAAAALLLGLVFLVPVILATLARWESAIRQTFIASIVYLPLLFAAMVADAR